MFKRMFRQGFLWRLLAWTGLPLGGPVQAVILEYAASNLPDLVAGQDRWSYQYQLSGRFGAFASVNLLYPADGYADLALSAPPDPAVWDPAIWSSLITPRTPHSPRTACSASPPWLRPARTSCLHARIHLAGKQVTPAPRTSKSSTTASTSSPAEAARRSRSRRRPRTRQPAAASPARWLCSSSVSAVAEIAAAAAPVTAASLLSSSSTRGAIREIAIIALAAGRTQRSHRMSPLRKTVHGRRRISVLLFSLLRRLDRWLTGWLQQRRARWASQPAVECRPALRTPRTTPPPLGGPGRRQPQPRRLPLGRPQRRHQRPLHRLSPRQRATRASRCASSSTPPPTASSTRTTLCVGQTDIAADSLNPGSNAITVSLDARAIAQPGRYTLIGVVDPDNAIAESDETNNQSIASSPLTLDFAVGQLPGRSPVPSLDLSDADGTACA
jgi:hypothetical protein